MKMVKLMLGFGFFVVLLHRVGVRYETIAEGIRSVPSLISALFVSIVIMPTISVNRWAVFLRMTGVVEKVPVLIRINFISQFQGLVIPSTQGYDAFRMYHISKRHPGMSGSASGSVLVERMIGLLVFCGIALCGLPFVLQYSNQKIPILACVIGFSVTAAFGATLVLNRRVHNLYAGRRPRLKWLRSVVDFLDSTHATLVDFPYRKVLLSSVALIFLFQLSSILCVSFVFRAYGIDLPIHMHMALYPVVAVIAMTPVTIGGLGIREGAFAYFYSLVGVPMGIAVCVSVANYVILSLSHALIGAVICGWETCIPIITRRLQGKNIS